MKPEYYICWYRLDGKDRYLLWFEDEKDGVFVDSHGFVPAFDSVMKLLGFAEESNIAVDVENPKCFELDIVQYWLSDRESGKIDCNPFLDTWNLLEDLSRSTGGKFDSEKELTKKIYNKIFWGCNLSSVTPEGKSYTPVWTGKELKIIRKVLKFGLEMFREKVKLQSE